MFSGSCNIWSNIAVRWSDANWIWSIGRDCHPEPATAIFDTGIDASLIRPVDQYPTEVNEPWDAYKLEKEKKRKRLIKLICKVHGTEYNEEKQYKDFKISVDDIKLIIKSGSGINLNLRRE